jgi:protease-4
MMQHVIDDFYRQFVDVVAQGRKLSLQKTREVADGRIFTASQARDLGLVDQLGYLDDALELARVKAGLDDPKVITYHRPGSYKPTIYSLMPDLDMAGPQFLYLWWAGGT